MKILFCDFLYQNGNRHINAEHIKIMSSWSEVVVLAKDDYMDVRCDNVKFISRPYFEKQFGKLKILLNLIRVMYVSSKIAKKEKPDYLFFATYETRTFALGQLFFRNKMKIYLMENINIDLLDSVFSRYCYNVYKNKVHHIVMEKYMGDYLEENIGVKNSLIHHIPHPCYNTVLCSQNIFDCIALSYSNDESIIEEIVAIESRENILKNAGKCVVIKSKKISFNNGYLRVENRRYTDEEYNYLFSNTKMVYLPFPKSYRYRMSGNIIDAFGAKKVVITTDIMLATYYSEKYPTICKIIDDARSVINFIAENDSIECDENEFLDFLQDHSNKLIDEQFRKCFMQHTSV